jgi:hypothetical protein
MAPKAPPQVEKLGNTNYNQWSRQMKAWLRANSLWSIVSGQNTCPTVTDSSSEVDKAMQEVWNEKASCAAGWIYLMVSDEQTVHLEGKEDDPVAIWKALEAVHLQQKPGARFNAYDDLFSIRKTDEESLQSLVNRVDAALKHIKNLRPKDFSLDDLDNELLCMTMIRALPEDYNHFVSSLMLRDKLDKSSITHAFHTEEIQRTRRSAPQISEVAHKAAAVITTPTPTPSNTTNSSCNSACTGNHNHSTHPKKQFKKFLCSFCGKRGHGYSKCPLYLVKSAEAKAATAAEVQESAGKASIYTLQELENPFLLRSNYDWNADSGATSHMTPHRHWLRNYKPLHIPIRLADHTIIYSAGIGSILFKPFINQVESQSLIFSRVLHVPQLQNNLLSVLYLTKHKGYNINIDSQHINFIQSSRLLFTATINSQNAAFLDGCTVPASLPLESASLSSTLPLDLSLWHRRFGHTNHDYVKQLHSKDMVTGMKFSHMSKPDPICEPCLAGKMHANPFPTSQTRASKPLELVHVDLKGPIQVKSIAGGYSYWIQFVDDCTRFKCGLGLKKKSEAFAAFLQFKAYAENLHDAKIKVLREDKGSEFMSNEFNQYCIDNGIERQHTVRNRPQQNGDVERANRTVSDQVTSMLNEANLPVQFWFHAFVALLHVLNRTPTAPLPGKTPHEAWHSRKPDVSHLRVWGCLAYVHIQKDKRKSFGPHMEKCIFVGYPAGYKGWQFYNPVTRKFIISERAEFDERYFPGIKPTLMNAIPTPPSLNIINGSDMPDLGGHHINTNQSPKVSRTVVQMPMPSFSSRPVHNPSPSSESAQSTPTPSPPSVPTQLPSAPTSPITHTTPLPSPSPSSPSIAVRRTRRNVQPPGEWWKIRHPTPAIESSSESESESDPQQESSVEDEDEEFAGVAGNFYEPNTYKQAMKSPDAELWQQAAEEEINSLNANGTWDIVPLPKDRKAIGSRWVFKVKRNADGSIERYKARVVAKGFSQRPGVDYIEVFAPTFRMASIRTIIALAAKHDYHLHSIDISSAFLNGNLEEEIYMEQPPGFVQFGPEFVCKLKKSLYGLKQSARQWNKKLNATLFNLGYKRLESDRSIYVFAKDGVLVIIPVFIDDITLASNSQSKIDNTIKDLELHFKLRNLGPTSWLLGMKITRDFSNHSISLSQHQYISDKLREYGFSDCSPITTPMDPGLVLQKTQSLSDQDKEYMSKVPYLNAVGSLIYLSQCTRPDIAYAVGTLAKFNSNPAPIHWKAVKHVFRYLQGTKDYELVYKPDGEQELFITYSDSNHGACKDTGRSTGGYVVKIGTGAVSWSSKLQSVVALSTTEAEYIAAVEAGKELKWMRSLLGEFGYKFDSASTLCIDNQSSISVAKNPEHHGRMKHLDLKFHWLRENVEAGLIKPKHVGTNEMIADCLTKPLPRVKHDNCRIGLGLVKPT